MKRILLTFALASILLPAQAQKKTYDFPFQDPSLPMEERIDDLLSLLTPEEKIGLLMNKSISVDKLGIPSYNWWSEACHGVRADGYTVYPQTIAMGASFDADLVYRIYESVSDEARANWNRSQREWNVDDQARYYPGNPELSFWCPNINIFRDPPSWACRATIPNTSRRTPAPSTTPSTAVRNRSVTAWTCPFPCATSGRPTSLPSRRLLSMATCVR